MKALVTGATGFIGQRLVGALEGAVVLTRDPERARRLLGPDVQAFAWDAEKQPAPAEAFAGVEAVFHLAGEPVAAGRWTEARKERIRQSRVLGTRNLVATISQLPQKPRVLVSASAVGYYGDRGEETLDESSRPGAGFLARLCVEWEAEANRAAGPRVVMLRIGIVLGEGGGALARMLPPFRLGLGGPLGSGQHWMSWVHLEDVAGLLLHAATRDDVAGAMNAVAPEPVRNKEFTRTLGRVLRRPAILPAPGFALRAAFGEMATVLLASQRVVPRMAQATNYNFRYPSLEQALRAAVGRPGAPAQSA